MDTHLNTIQNIRVSIIKEISILSMKLIYFNTSGNRTVNTEYINQHMYYVRDLFTYGSALVTKLSRN